jgi:putative DNA primase/helicase
MTAPALRLVKDNTPNPVPEDGSLSPIDAEITRLAGELLPPAAERFNDIANAKRFLADIGSDLLYCKQAEKWMLWDGTRWATDNSDFVFQYAEAFAEKLYDGVTDQKSARYKNAERANNRAGFEAFQKLAQRSKSVEIATFDAIEKSGHLLNCRNGTLDLSSGELRPHSREDRITRVVGCDYDPEPKTTVWREFIASIMPDAEIRDFLQRCVGYSIAAPVAERAFFLLHGTGANGKSIFINTLNGLLGEYASSADSASFMATRFPSGSQPTPDLARLKGKRFIVVPETQENERLNSTLIKSLSAGDSIVARFLFADVFEFPFHGKLWIATNHKPTITDHSPGFWDRLKLIPFTQRFEAANQLPTDHLMRLLRNAATEVLAWCVEGYREYQKGRLGVPESIQREIDAYKYEQDSIAQFLDERCCTWEQANARRPDVYHIASEYRVSNTDLYKAYEKFCKENGEYARSHRRLTQNMFERGFKQLNSGGRYWDGLRVVNSEQ